MPQTPLILISNDDGITAPGIEHLVKLMSTLGEVVVVAPDSPQSGMGHAITIGEPLRMESSNQFDDIESYEINGTPADCIKLAKHHVFHNRTPDLVVSGINHGANSSVNVLYSGTMSAAIEGAIEGLPSIGFSVCDFNHDADLSYCDDIILDVCRFVLESGIKPGTALNVNFPAKSDEPLKGYKLCKQAHAKWEEKFDVRMDPYKRKYYWMVGAFVDMDEALDTDIKALKANYASVVPCQYDLTSYSCLEDLRKRWEK